MIEGENKQMKPSDVKKKVVSKKKKSESKDEGRMFFFPARNGDPALTVKAANREDAVDAYKKSLK